MDESILPPYLRKIRRKLREQGTDVDLNDRDECGDGDQTPIRPQMNNDPRQYFRELWAHGGDIHIVLERNEFSPFAMLCVSGIAPMVQEKLQEAAASDEPYATETWPGPHVRKLLEFRETCMRLSPILMMASVTKNLAMDKTQALSTNQIQVAKLLLQYGARADAKDLVGKTVCHYGMGSMATELTLEVGRMCIEAHRSGHLMGKRVELYGLKTESMNGKQGIARGYISDTGRRVVYLLDDKKELSILPENIRLAVKDDDVEQPVNLCDIQDRLGVVCLQESIMGNRVDVAKILLEEYNANVTSEDWDGCSPLSMSQAPGASMMSEVATMIQKKVARDSRAEQKAQRNQCMWCKKSDVTLFACARCRKVQYCSKDCQTQDWKKGGHKKNCETIATKDHPVVLEDPSSNSEKGMHYGSINFRTGTKTFGNSNSIRKPTNIGFDEQFYIKVQCGMTKAAPLLIYDKTRECNFMYAEGQRGFDEMFEAARAQRATQGRKTYLKASVDRLGKMTVYPGTSTMKTW